MGMKGKKREKEMQGKPVAGRKRRRGKKDGGRSSAGQLGPGRVAGSAQLRQGAQVSEASERIPARRGGRGTDRFLRWVRRSIAALPLQARLPGAMYGGQSCFHGDWAIGPAGEVSQS